METYVGYKIRLKYKMYLVGPYDRRFGAKCTSCSLSLDDT